MSQASYSSGSVGIFFKYTLSIVGGSRSGDGFLVTPLQWEEGKREGEREGDEV